MPNYVSLILLSSQFHEVSDNHTGKLTNSKATGVMNFCSFIMRRSRALQKCLLAACLFALVSQAYAQEASSPTLPGAILMPWVVWGLNEEQTAQISPHLTTAQRNLARIYLNATSSLSDFVRTKSPLELTINTQRISDQVVVGSLKNDADSGSVTIQPLLCPISDRYVVAIELIDTIRDTIIGSSHETITRQRLQELGRDRALFEQTFRDLVVAQLGSALKQRKSLDDKTAMHLSLSLGRESGRMDGGSYLCLNMLLAHELAKKYPVNHEIGNNESYQVRRLLSTPGRPQRASRRLVVVWSMEDYLRFPVKINQTIRISESVLTGRIDAPMTYDFDLEANPQLVMPVSPQLSTFLENEALALDKSALPKIAKIYRGWAYLDMGRAFGLKMSDRLYMRKNGETIKGHVVGFYGPGLGIKSPRGFPVHEGAIVFIRKGRTSARIGDEWLYDPTTFPTAWPPVPTPP